MKRLWNKKFIVPLVTECLALFGILDLITQFAPTFDWLKPVSEWLRTSPWWYFGAFAGATLLISGWKNWPKTAFEYRLKGRDVCIRLVIGDVFEQMGAVVVPINDAFDVSLGGSVGKAKSVKAQVIEQVFGGDADLLDHKIKKQLVEPIYSHAHSGNRWVMGTTVCVEQNHRRLYLTVNSVKTTGTRVEARKNDLVPTLSGLWAHLADHGAKEDVIVPLMGTGNGRLTVSREEVFREIVRSFVVSCAVKCYCDRLIVVIQPADVSRNQIDIDGLDDFLRLSCQFATFEITPIAPTGNAVAS